jgi:hypothetical protein
MRGKSKGAMLYESRAVKPSEWAVSETVPGFSARVRVRLSIHQEVSRQPHAAFNKVPPFTRGSNLSAWHPGSDALPAILAAAAILVLMLLALALDFAPRVSSLGSQADSPPQRRSDGTARKSNVWSVERAAGARGAGIQPSSGH